MQFKKKEKNLVRPAPSGSPTRAPRSTPLPMLVSSLLSDPHTPLVILPSWLVTGLAFLSPPWVLLLAPCLPNVLVAPQMVHNLLSIRQFTADNSFFIEFDSSGLTVKDSASRRPLLLCDSTGLLYTLRLPSSAAPLLPSSSSAAFAAPPSSTTWHCRLGHPGRDVLAQLSRSTDVPCTRAPAEHLCHACQLGRHVRLPFSSSSSHATPVFDLVHCDLWTSPVLSFSG